MEFRPLGNSGIDVSALSLGSWLTYEYMEEDEALAVLTRGLEAGITFLDDARYDDKTGKAPLKSGYSEVVFGRLLRKSGWQRSELVIANKLWFEFYPQEGVEAEIDGSLSRLQMDYIDLIYCMLRPKSISIAELVRQMNVLLQTGKARYWGVANWSAADIAEAYAAAKAEGLQPPCAAQLPYSVLNTSYIEPAEAQRIYDETGIGLVASYSLYGGLLSGKYNQMSELEGRFSAEQIETMREQGLLEKVTQVVELAQEVGCTPAQLALAYCLRNRHVASLLFGATKIAQIDDNLRALEIAPTLSEEMMDTLSQLA